MLMSFLHFLAARSGRNLNYQASDICFSGFVIQLARRMTVVGSNT